MMGSAAFTAWAFGLLFSTDSMAAVCFSWIWSSFVLSGSLSIRTATDLNMDCLEMGSHCSGDHQHEAVMIMKMELYPVSARLQPSIYRQAYRNIKNGTV